MSKSKPAFTLIEMLVILPIALIMVSGIVLATIKLTNQAVLANERAKKTADLHRALKIIEKDISLTSNFLPKVTLVNYQGDEISATVNSSSEATFLSNSVNHGNLAVYDESDRPVEPFSVNQPRLILKRLATLTNPDADDYLKKLSHFQDGPYSGQDCHYNSPVFLNVVYYVKKSALYRRIILHSADDLATNQDKSIYCSYTKDGKTINEVPWQLPTCAKVDYVNNAYTGYCQAKDELLINQVEFDVQYFSNNQTIDNALINDATRSNQDRADELAKADGAEVKLTAKIVLAEGDAETIVSSRIIANKVPLTAVD